MYTTAIVINAEKIEGILKELSGFETISWQHSLQGDLALDSLAMVMLLVQIEEVFHFELDESDMNPFELKTVQDVIDLVNRYYGIADE